MQLTYKMPVDSLNDDFLEAIKSRFAGREVSITIEEVQDPEEVDQMERFYKMEKLRKKLERIKVDPSIDLSALANEVNL